MTFNNFSTRITCRVCHRGNLLSLFSLGRQYVSNFLDRPDSSRETECPLDLVMCHHCKLVQLRHTAPQSILYSRHYWYRSGVTDTMRRALEDVVRHATSLVELKPDDCVLDIGSNDGTLLRQYKNYCAYDIHTVGVEPATNLAEEGSRGVSVFINDFWMYKGWLRRMENQRAKIVTACGMFYDLEEPNQFIEDVAKVLHKDGIFVAQLMCLRNTIDSMDVGNFAHEHLEYYSMRSLHELMGNHGLEIFDVDKVEVNGGSYRLSIQHKGGPRPIYGSVAAADTADKELEDPLFYDNFQASLLRNKWKVRDFVKNQVLLNSKRVWVYGASTKGNVILQYYDLDHKVIEAASDRSPEKWGKYTVGTHIPIKSEADARSSNPDFFLVLPYAFLNEFIEREDYWLGEGGVFIVPLPTPRIVYKTSKTGTVKFKDIR